MAALQIGDDPLKVGFVGAFQSLGGLVVQGHLLAAPAAIEDKVQLAGQQLAHRYVQGDVLLGRCRLQELAVVAIAGSLVGPGLYGPLAQGLAAIGDDQVGFNLQLGAQAGTGGASAVGAVEREGARLDLGEADATMDAGEMLGI